MTIRDILNKHKYTGSLDKIKLMVDFHLPFLEPVMGRDIKEIWPRTISMGGDLEIPYHRIKEVYFGDKRIFPED